jgi:hypothetical protein
MSCDTEKGIFKLFLMLCTVWQAQPLHGSIVLNYFSSRSKTIWIFTEEIERYKCECLHTIKKGIYRQPCEENKKKALKKIWSQSARVTSFGIGILPKGNKN